jgi:hypothetical protein
MWTATFVTLVVIGIVVAAHEWYERVYKFNKLREEVKKYQLDYFYEVLRYYDERPTMSVQEVASVNELLKKAAKRVAVYYPGFTAPTLV